MRGRTTACQSALALFRLLEHTENTDDRPLNMDHTQWPQSLHHVGRAWRGLSGAPDQYRRRRAIHTRFPRNRAFGTNPCDPRPRDWHDTDGIGRDPALAGP